MTPRSAPPTDAKVQQAIAALTEATGKPPSAFALAQYFGIPSTNFRRRFPDFTAHLTLMRRIEARPADDRASSLFEELKQQNARLRRDDEDLSTHLELAIANIQRLTLENHRLRRQRDEAARVTSLSKVRQERKLR